ncbi:hypothetical protein SCACP_03880 [Sporomusa carbonis]|uniref:hypothetical protein n=1 Tax=Sporomusa carbonis TaxID=3076075 RepID=UPI003A68204E
MQKSINKLIIALTLLTVLMLYPSQALAADFSFNINIVRQDGSTCGELWFNDKLVWRLAVLPDGAKPVSGGVRGANTTLIIPDIVNGMFVVKVE